MTKTHHGLAAWKVTFTGTLFFFYAFMQLTLPNAINPSLIEAFHLSSTEVSLLATTYFLANALFLFPAGILLDRYSTKKLLLIATALTTIGTCIFGTTHHYVIAASSRFLVGIGAAFCFLSCVRLASRWFPPSRMALVTGLCVTLAMVGGLVAQSPMVFLVKTLGWRQAILLDSALGVLIFIAIAWVVQDRPLHAQETAKSDKAKLKNLGLWHCIKLVLLNQQNWFAGLYTALLNLPIFLLGSLWGVTYLIQIHQLSHLEASYVTSMLFVGAIVGSPTYGWISDHIGRRCLPMIIGAILSFIVIMILMYTPHLGLAALMALFFAIGCFTCSQVLPYPTVAELNPTALTGTATSIVSITLMWSGVIFQPLFGWLLERSGDSKLVDNVTVYSATSFNHAMWIMPVAFLIGLVIACMIRETYCELQT